MILHILNGDALAENFSVEGQVLVWREILVESALPQMGSTFLDKRANSLNTDWGIPLEEYHQKTKEVQAICYDDYSEIALWFGRDLFCQANLFFWVNRLHGFKGEVSIVQPEKYEFELELTLPFKNRMYLKKASFDYAEKWWAAFTSNTPDVWLKMETSPEFSDANEALFNQARRLPSVENGLNRLENTIIAAQMEGITDVTALMRHTWGKHPEYGFGDFQLEKIFSQLSENQVIIKSKKRFLPTELAENLLQNRVDFWMINEKSRRISNVELHPFEAIWRWDETIKKIVLK